MYLRVYMLCCYCLLMRLLMLMLPATTHTHTPALQKYDVVKVTHQIDVEYGNVGIDFQCVVKEGFGWMNASYVVGHAFLSKKLKSALGALVPPDRAAFC